MESGLSSTQPSFSSEYDAKCRAAYLITALTEESAGPLREKLVDDLADALDYLGVGVALDVASPRVSTCPSLQTF